VLRTKPPAPFRRMSDFVCMSIPRIRRYGVGNVCSRLIEFPALQSPVARETESSIDECVS